MLAMSPPCCFGSILGEAEFSDSVLHFPSFLDDLEIRCEGEDTTSSSPQVKNDDQVIQVKQVKKLNHNANERDRRKKINGLYKSLRDLLPPVDQQKKLSIPTTVSRVVQYIPELEKEVESLIQKKEKILNIIPQEEKTCHFQKKMKCYSNNSLAAITATQVNDKEIMVQVSIMEESSRASFAQALFNLEQDHGLLLLNSSVFQTSEARVFYNLHLQVEATTQILELEGLKQKLFALFEKQQHLPLIPNFSSNNYMETIF